MNSLLRRKVIAGSFCLIVIVLIVGALTFFPALSLGPIVEHFLMHGGKLFSTILTPHLFWS